MKRYGNIYEKICDIENLEMAHMMAKKDKSYYREVKMVDKEPLLYLTRIQRMLQDKTYHIMPNDYSYQIINDKGKERELMKLPYYPHRIIQWAIMLQIEGIFLKTFVPHTCASIPDRGIKGVYNYITKWVNNDKENTKYVLQMDVKKFYPSIDHEILKQLLRKKFKDPDLLWLLDLIIDSYPGIKGVPIGSFLSQYLANYYLAYMDHYIEEELNAKYMIRYMDDILVFADNKAFLHNVRIRVETYLNCQLKLKLKDNWQVYPVDKRGVSFVGYRYFRGYVLLKKKSLNSIKRVCRRVMEKQKRGKRISYRDFSSLNSYAGWAYWSNDYRFFEKWIKPVRFSLYRYYDEVICRYKPMYMVIHKETVYRMKFFKKQERRVA